MFDQIEVFLQSFAAAVPVWLFVFIGSILEEIIAPIPSPFVMTTAGSLLAAQGSAYSAILVIALIAAVGKTIGCIFFYILADKAEDVVLKRWGKYLGFSHTQVESIGKHFDGSIKDDLIIILLRALPVMPSTPVSLAAGFLKINIYTYTRATFIGNFFRAIIFLYIGYEGLHTLTQGIDSLESVIKILIVIGLAALVGFVYYKRGKGDLHTKIKSKLKL